MVLGMLTCTMIIIMFDSVATAMVFYIHINIQDMATLASSTISCNCTTVLYYCAAILLAYNTSFIICRSLMPSEMENGWG